MGARRNKMIRLVEQAVLATADRPPGLRGPYVFDEDKLQHLAKRIRAGRRAKHG